MPSTPKHSANQARTAARTVHSILTSPVNTETAPTSTAGTETPGAVVSRDYFDPSDSRSVWHSSALLVSNNVSSGPSGITVSFKNVSKRFPGMYLDDTGRKAFNRQNGDANFLWKSIQCVHEGLKAGTVPVSDMPQIVLSYLLVNGRSLSGVPGINADSLDFAASASPSPAKGRGKQMVATPSTGGRPTVIQPSPAGTVAPPTSDQPDVATMLVERMEQMTATQEKTAEHQKQMTATQEKTAEHQKQTTLVQDKLWEKVEEHGGDIATLQGQMVDVNDTMGQFSGRLEVVEAFVGSPQGVAARGAFSFGAAATGGDKKLPALASGAPTAGGGFGSRTTAATITAGIPPQGVAAPGPFAGTATATGGDKKLPALASVAPTVGGGFGGATAAATTSGFFSQGVAAPGPFASIAAASDGAKEVSALASDALAARGGFGSGTTAATAASLKSSSDGSILTLGAVAGSAGAGAGINGAGFFFNGPTAGSFGTPKNSALSAAPSAAPSGKNAVGFQQDVTPTNDGMNVYSTEPKRFFISAETGGARRFWAEKVDINKRDDGPHFFLAREDSTGKVIANHSITSMSKLGFREGTDATLFWCAQDFSTGVFKLMYFYLEFADRETAAAFKEKVEELQM